MDVLLVTRIIAFLAIAFVMNIPFGSYRNLTRKFSWQWFLAIHATVPLIIFMRIIIFHVPIWIFPFSIAFDIAGQQLGVKFDFCKARAKLEAAAEAAKAMVPVEIGTDMES
jgi:phosphatidylserine synthase